MRWVLATGNRHKYEEISAILEPTGVRVVDPATLDDRPDPEEYGVTFAANALIKAVTWAARYGAPALADDSGLEVDALGGAPGVFSSRFSGPGATDATNNAHLLAQLADKPGPNTARFRCVLALAFVEGTSPSPVDLPEEIEELAHPNEMPSEGVRAYHHEGVRYVVSTFSGAMEGAIAREAQGAQGFGYDPLFVIDDGRHLAELSAAEKNAMSHRAVSLNRLHKLLALSTRSK